MDELSRAKAELESDMAFYRIYYNPRFLAWLDGWDTEVFGLEGLA